MTQKIRNIVVMAVVLVQVAFFIGWYAHEAGAFGEPIARIKVKTVAYDPRDLLSGQYIRLQYEFSRPAGRWNSELQKTIVPEWAQDLPEFSYAKDKGRDLWLLLYEREGVYEPKQASYERPDGLGEGEVLLRGRIFSSWDVKYGIEKYFVPEGTSEPDRDKTVVELDIYDGGKARIHQVYVNGKAWP